MRDIDSNQDQINVEDITDRLEELEGECGNIEELREELEEVQGRYDDVADDPDTSEGEKESLADELADARKALDDAEKWADENPDDADEFRILTELVNELQGNGGDHQWRGDWYPGYLIRESYFVEYCQHLLDDIGDLPKDLPSYIAIDWEKTADNLRVDYSESEYEGVTYLYR